MIHSQILKNKNIYLVEYVPELRKKLTTCAGYITYGGYNATVEILKGQIPSILVPRQSGKKMEQFIRAFTSIIFCSSCLMAISEGSSPKIMINGIVVL